MKLRFVPYNKNLKEFSRDLRNNSTLSEVLLWNRIKGRQVRGYQFLRQKPIDNYIADFFCHKLKLVIEVDGSSHADEDAKGYDEQRDMKMQQHGLFVMRIDDLEVKRNISAALNEIEFYIDDFERELRNEAAVIPPLERGLGGFEK